MFTPLLHPSTLNLGYAKRLVADVMAAQENMHLGQQSGWRRVHGMGWV